MSDNEELDRIQRLASQEGTDDGKDQANKENQELIEALLRRLDNIEASNVDETGEHRMRLEIPHYLLELGNRELAEEAVRMLLNDTLKAVLLPQALSDGIHFGHSPHQVVDFYFKFLPQGINDLDYHKIALAIEKVDAIRLEAEQRYTMAAIAYEHLGLSEKAMEMHSKPSVDFEDRDDPDYTMYFKEIKEVQERFKDFAFMDQSERVKIAEDIRKELTSRLAAPATDAEVTKYTR